MGKPLRHEKASKSWDEKLRVDTGPSQYRSLFFSVRRHFSYFQEHGSLFLFLSSYSLYIYTLTEASFLGIQWLI